jgi:hypothetical protein
MNDEHVHPQPLSASEFSLSKYPESDESSDLEDEGNVSEDPSDYGKQLSEKGGEGSSSEKSSHEESVDSWEEPDTPWKWS